MTIKHGTLQSIVSAAELITRYEEASPGTTARFDAFKELTEVLSDVEISARSEPRRVVSDFLGALYLAAPENLIGLLIQIAGWPAKGISTSAFCALVQMVAAAGVSDEATAFAFFDRLKWSKPEQSLLDRTIVAICSILGKKGSVSLLSLLERIEEAGLANPSVYYAVLRGAAAREPSSLPSLFRATERILGPGQSPEDVEGLRFQIEAIASQAGTLTLLRVILNLDPRRFEAALEAAFEGPDAPFKIINTFIPIDENTFEQEVTVEAENKVYHIDDLGKFPLNREWFRMIRKFVTMRTRTRERDAADMVSIIAIEQKSEEIGTTQEIITPMGQVSDEKSALSPFDMYALKENVVPFAPRYSPLLLSVVKRLDLGRAISVVRK